MAKFERFNMLIAGRQRGYWRRDEPRNSIEPSIMLVPLGLGDETG